MNPDNFVLTLDRDEMEGRLNSGTTIASVVFARKGSAKERALQQTEAEAASLHKFSFENLCGKTINLAVLYQPVEQNEWNVTG